MLVMTIQLPAQGSPNDQWENRMRSPRIRCEAWDTAYFGYGDTEYHECRSPAEYRGKVNMPYVGVERVQLCKHHASQEKVDKFYRFRKVT